MPRLVRNVRLLTTKELKEMKERARVNEGNFWHGFISFNEEDSSKIDHVEKCFVKLPHNKLSH